MTHRERVLAALRHETPDRVPAHVINIDDPQPFLDRLALNDLEELRRHWGFDIRRVMPALRPGREGDISTIFGLPGGATDYSTGTHPRPFAECESVRDVEAYPWPSVDWVDFDSIQADLDRFHGHYAVMVNEWTPVFCHTLDFFGMERALYTLYTNPALIEATVAHVEAFYLEYFERLFQTAGGRADIFSMGDDFASQQGLMMNPDLWRRFFKPTYARIFRLAHDNGLYVWFHSCGAIRAVLGDLVDIGMDVWETVQTHLPGNEPEALKRDFGEHITFFGGINTQQTLPYGTPEDVRRQVRERVRVLGRGGGYVCGPDHHIKVDVPADNAIALYDEIRAFRHEGCTLA